MKKGGSCESPFFNVPAGLRCSSRHPNRKTSRQVLHQRAPPPVLQRRGAVLHPPYQELIIRKTRMDHPQWPPNQPGLPRAFRDKIESCATNVLQKTLPVVWEGVSRDSYRPPTSQAFAISIKSIIFANQIVALVGSHLIAT